MRIAIIAPPWVPVPPPAYGGTEAVLDALATGLQAVGHDVLLYATGDSTCQVPTAWTLPSAVGTVGIVPATEINHVVHAYAAVHDWGADVVHDHTLVGPLYANRFPVPVVTTNHGPFDGEAKTRSPQLALATHRDLVGVALAAAVAAAGAAGARRR